jgi:hypothetical protein
MTATFVLRPQNTLVIIVTITHMHDTNDRIHESPCWNLLYKQAGCILKLQHTMPSILKLLLFLFCVCHSPIANAGHHDPLYNVLSTGYRSTTTTLPPWRHTSLHSSEVTGTYYCAPLNGGLKTCTNLYWSQQPTPNSSTPMPSQSRSCQWPRVTSPLHSLCSHQARGLGCST